MEGVIKAEVNGIEIKLRLGHPHPKMGDFLL